MASRRGALGLSVGLLVLVTACDDGRVVRPAPQLFDRYVALGNSITAGFQSFGINDSTQREAYPVLLAARAGAEFGVPGLALPGCPPPVVDAFTREPVGEGPCAFRQQPLPTRVDNLAVPGAALVDLLDRTRPGASANPLTGLILGALDPIEWLEQAPATLVSVWIGNNDALYAALNANTGLLTPLASFESELAEFATRLAATGPLDVILIGVVDPTFAPALQPGAFYWGLAALPEPPVPIVADESCAPDSPGGALLVSALILLNLPASVSCDEQAPFVLSADAQALISARVASYNAALVATAAARGWLYVDANEILAPLLEDADQIRKCQDLLAATTPAEFAAALAATCPGQDAPNVFGTILSLDGVHPSGAGHALVARELALRLNARHGLGLPLD